MDSLQNVLESAGLPAQRGVYTEKKKPAAYYTFLRIMKNAAVNADDKRQGSREMYRVTLFSKVDFEEQLEKTLETLEVAGYYINSVDTEEFETETGYWYVPITIEILKE